MLNTNHKEKPHISKGSWMSTLCKYSNEVEYILLL